MTEGERDARALARTIDHTFLGPAGDAEAVRRLCREADACGFASVCVNPAEVRLAAGLLADSPVAVCTVVGFPLGQATTDVKRFEAEAAVADGATELDFVVNQRLLKYDGESCRAELQALSAACRALVAKKTGRAPVTKLILECCNLTPDEIVRGCRYAKEAGFDFVKTSTGFGAHGARVEDVRLMRETVGPGMGVKAAGGIRDRATAEAMLAAGATRLGTSAGVALVAKTKLFVATHNAHKVREIGQILPAFEIVPDDPEGVEENAPDFAGNALIKVRAIAARHAGAWCLADDSGLEVVALGGEPGVRSARYAGEPCDTPRNNALLIANLAGVADRRARFTCCCALVSPEGEEFVVEGHCPGVIRESASGAEGFGYDPLFVPDGYDRTFAELSADEKNAISHRGRALAEVRKVIAAHR